MIDKIIKAYGDMVDKISKSIKRLNPKSTAREYYQIWDLAVDLARVEIETNYETMKLRKEKFNIKKLEKEFKDRTNFHIKI